MTTLEQLRDHTQNNIDAITSRLMAAAPPTPDGQRVPPRWATTLKCADGTLISVQAGVGFASTPNVALADEYTHYECVGEALDGNPFPDSWKEFSSNQLPDLFEQVPAEMVLEFINEHGGMVENDEYYHVAGLIEALTAPVPPSFRSKPINRELN
jgi:hypothetical protein